MVTSIARQSVIIKSKTGNSILLGNYECGYCLGLFSKAAGIPEDDSYQDMVSWHEQVMSQMEGFTSEDKQLMEILRITREYEPTSFVDDQVRELYHMGLSENRMWQM